MLEGLTHEEIGLTLRQNSIEVKRRFRHRIMAASRPAVLVATSAERSTRRHDHAQSTVNIDGSLVIIVHP
jgi:hypothetical protein